jgi:hypothetical protein
MTDDGRRSTDENLGQTTSFSKIVYRALVRGPRSSVFGRFICSRVVAEMNG